MLPIRLLAFLFLTAAAPAQDGAEQWKMAPADAVKAVSALAGIEAHDPGGTLIVSHGEKVLLTQSFGAASLSAGAPCTAETLYRSDPSTRSASTVLALEMAKAGALDLDDSISELLPALAKVPTNATVNDLIHQRCRLHHLEALFYFRHLGEHGHLTREEVIEVLGQTRSLSDFPDPRTNRLVLEASLEAVSGQSIGTLLQTYVFEPAGMSNAHYAADELEIVRGSAQPVIWHADRNQWIADKPRALTIESGSIWLSAQDALAYARYFGAYLETASSLEHILAHGPTERTDDTPEDTLTVRFAKQDLYITWITGAKGPRSSKVPAHVGLHMLGRSDEMAGPLLGIGGGAGGKFGGRLDSYQGSLQVGSFVLPCIGQHLVLSEDKRGWIYASTVGVSHQRVKVGTTRPGETTFIATVQGQIPVTDRLTPTELAGMSDEKRRMDGYNRKGIRRRMERHMTVHIKFEIVEGGPARPVSVDLRSYLPVPLVLDNLLIQPASKLGNR